MLSSSLPTSSPNFTLLNSSLNASISLKDCPTCAILCKRPTPEINIFPKHRRPSLLCSAPLSQRQPSESLCLADSSISPTSIKTARTRTPVVPLGDSWACLARARAVTLVATKLVLPNSHYWAVSSERRIWALSPKLLLQKNWKKK